MSRGLSPTERVGPNSSLSQKSPPNLAQLPFQNNSDFRGPENRILQINEKYATPGAYQLHSAIRDNSNDRKSTHEFFEL